MKVEQLQPGDAVYAARAIYNDGSVPGAAENELLADTGCRGVILTTGHLEENPGKKLILVRFESAADPTVLGPAVACWLEELNAEQGLI